MESVEQSRESVEYSDVKYDQPIETEGGREISEESELRDSGFADARYDAPIDSGCDLVKNQNERAETREIDNEFLSALINLMPERQPYSEKLIQNKRDGLAREDAVLDDLLNKYDPLDGYDIFEERYLCDSEGNRVKDVETGSGRRIDFVVVRDGKVVDSVEVTSETADKTQQTAKEDRIRENGGIYIKNPYDSSLVLIDDSVRTRIERRA